MLLLYKMEAQREAERLSRAVHQAGLLRSDITAPMSAVSEGPGPAYERFRFRLACFKGGRDKKSDLIHHGIVRTGCAFNFFPTFKSVKLSGGCETVDYTFENSPAIGTAECWLIEAFGVGHHAEDAASPIADAGDIALGAVG